MTSPGGRTCFAVGGLFGLNQLGVVAIDQNKLSFSGSLKTRGVVRLNQGFSWMNILVDAGGVGFIWGAHWGYNSPLDEINQASNISVVGTLSMEHSTTSRSNFPQGLVAGIFNGGLTQSTNPSLQNLSSQVQATINGQSLTLSSVGADDQSGAGACQIGNKSIPVGRSLLVYTDQRHAPTNGSCEKFRFVCYGVALASFVQSGTVDLSLFPAGTPASLNRPEVSMQDGGEYAGGYDFAYNYPTAVQGVLKRSGIQTQQDIPPRMTWVANTSKLTCP